MRPALPAIALLLATACETFEIEDADHAYATLDHAAYGIGETLSKARRGASDPSVTLGEPDGNCAGTCRSVHATLTGTTDLDWEGSVVVDGTLLELEASSERGASQSWELTLTGTMRYNGHEVRSGAEPMRLVIFEGDDFNRLFDSRPDDVVWVNLAACGAEVDTFRDIDLSYWGFHSTTALKQLSGLDIRSNERAGMLLDERAAGFSFDDFEIGGEPIVGVTYNEICP